MATKVEKRDVRKKQTAEAMGLDYEQMQKDKNEPEKKGFWARYRGSETRWKWTLFFIEILLIYFIFNFGQ